jgi:hypothetical protein
VAAPTIIEVHGRPWNIEADVLENLGLRCLRLEIERALLLYDSKLGGPVSHHSGANTMVIILYNIL